MSGTRHLNVLRFQFARRCNGVTSLACAAISRRSRIGGLLTQMSTHWRTGTCGSEPGRRLPHAPGPAGRTEPAPVAAKRDKLVVAAVATVQAQEALCQDAAFEEGVELSFTGWADHSRSATAHKTALPRCSAPMADSRSTGTTARPTPWRASPTWPVALRPGPPNAVHRRRRQPRRGRHRQHRPARLQHQHRGVRRGCSQRVGKTTPNKRWSSINSSFSFMVPGGTRRAPWR